MASLGILQGVCASRLNKCSEWEFVFPQKGSCQSMASTRKKIGSQEEGFEQKKDDKTSEIHSFSDSKKASGGIFEHLNENFRENWNKIGNEVDPLRNSTTSSKEAKSQLSEHINSSSKKDVQLSFILQIFKKMAVSNSR